MPEASVVLSGTASSVPVARRFVTDTLETWGLDGATWAAQQIIGELAANCALHARTEFRVRLVRGAQDVRLEVSDGSPAGVRPRRYSNESTTGRGLRLVEDLAAAWGVDRDAAGKTVWVTLRLSYDDEQQLDGELTEAELTALLSGFEDDSDLRGHSSAGRMAA